MKYTNKHDFPDFLVQALIHSDYKRSNIQKGDISVSALLQSPQQRILRNRHYDELEEDVIDLMWRKMGDAVHHVFSTPFLNNPDYLIENDFIVEINGWKVKMRSDMYIKSKLYLNDYKYTSVWSYILGDKYEWKTQVNWYKFILTVNGLPVNEAVITAVFRDWKIRDKEKNPEDYPETKVMVLPQELMDMNDIKETMFRAVIRHQQAEQYPDQELPECTMLEKWEKPTIYAVKKKGGSRAIPGGLLTKESDAVNMVKTRPELEYETRRGVAIKCEEYCIVAKFCYQRKREYSENAARIREDGFFKQQEQQPSSEVATLIALAKSIELEQQKSKQ